MKQKHRRTHRRQKGRPGRAFWARNGGFVEAPKFRQLGLPANSGSNFLVPLVHQGEIIPPGVRAMFVRVQSFYGAGFFYIPGTDTALDVHISVQSPVETYRRPTMHLRFAGSFDIRTSIGPDGETVAFQSVQLDPNGEVVAFSIGKVEVKF